MQCCCCGQNNECNPYFASVETRSDMERPNVSVAWFEHFLQIVILSLLKLRQILEVFLLILCVEASSRWTVGLFCLRSLLAKSFIYKYRYRRHQNLHFTHYFASHRCYIPEARVYEYMASNLCAILSLI